MRNRGELGMAEPISTTGGSGAGGGGALKRAPGR